MSKERYNQIIDEVYENYLTNFIPPNCPSYLDVQPSYYEPMTKEWFVKSIKEWGTRGEEFSQEWELTIEERVLTPKERIELAGGKIQDKYPALVEMSLRVCDERDIPTRLITLTYNNETIETYE